MKTAYLVFAVAACGAGSTGGGYTYKLEPAPNAEVHPKPADCSFQVGVAAPPGNYVTLGTLTPTDFAAPSLDQLHQSIQAQVCQLGGEVVVAPQSTDGMFRKAVVLRAPMAQPAAGSAAP